MPARQTVVDASVVVKWFLPEPSRPAALRLLRHYQDDDIQLFAPALVILEVSSVFCKRIRRGQMSTASAKEGYQFLKIHAPILVDDEELIDVAMTLALASGQSVYDCLYLALALRQRCEMITADEKFHAAVTGAFRNVLPLGALFPEN
jgi:predicted nucleic acid-binding protein